MSIVAPACPKAAHDAPNPIHQQTADAGVELFLHDLPAPPFYGPDLDVLAVSRRNLHDPEVARQVGELLAALPQLRASRP